MRAQLHFDAVVIGAGTAGLTAATRLAQGGARVCVLAKGVGSTHLAPGTIDVLGYAPKLVREPLSAIKKLAPDHPYSLLGADAVVEALQWFDGLRRRRSASGLQVRREFAAQRSAADGGRRPAAVGAGAGDGGGRQLRAPSERLHCRHPRLA